MDDQPCTQAPTSNQVEHRTSWLYLMIQVTVAIVTAPYRRTFKWYTWRPLKEIRAADGDRKLLISLVRDWKANKYAELQSVQVAASFCTGATFATISWSKQPDPLWVTDALWFFSLICSIWAVITSIQTKSILDDLPDRDQLNPNLPEMEVQRMLRVILRYKKTPGLKHYIMLFVWQFPSMTMSYAWCTFLSGLTVYVCTPFIRNVEWDNRHKIAIVYLTVGGVGLVTYIFSSVFVYIGEKDFERSATSTRASTFLQESIVGLSAPYALAETETGQQGASNADDPVRSVRERCVYGGDGRAESRRSTGKSRRQLLI